MSGTTGQQQTLSLHDILKSGAVLVARKIDPSSSEFKEAVAMFQKQLAETLKNKANSYRPLGY